MSDLISRQQAIEFVDYLLSQPCKGHTGDFVEGMRDGYYRIRSVIKYLPSAQPETHDKRTETHECDLINRQQVIDAVKDLPNCRNGFSDTYDKACIIGVLEDLPTAQPQRKKGKWITVLGRLGNEVECNQCHSVFWYWMGNYRFCPSCGARMDGESE